MSKNLENLFNLRNDPKGIRKEGDPRGRIMGIKSVTRQTSIYNTRERKTWNRKLEQYPIYEHGGPDPMYDSRLWQFNGAFDGVLGINKDGTDTETIQDFIRNQYPDKETQKNLVFAEIFGPAIQLSEDFEKEGLFSRTVGFVAGDPRSPKEKEIEKEKGRHEIVECNALTNYQDKHTKEKYPHLRRDIIEKWVKENGSIYIDRDQKEKRGLDLIIVRPGNGTHNIHPDLILYNLLKWYELLTDTGTILIRLPERFAFNDEDLENIQKTFKDNGIALQINTEESGKTEKRRRHTLRITRTKDSPERLFDILDQAGLLKSYLPNQA